MVLKGMEKILAENRVETLIIEFCPKSDSFGCGLSWRFGDCHFYSIWDWLLSHSGGDLDNNSYAPPNLNQNMTK